MLSPVLSRRLALSRTTSQWVQSLLGRRTFSHSVKLQTSSAERENEVISSITQDEILAAPKTCTLRIGGMPNSMLHEDVWRLLNNSKVQQVSKVELVYHRLFPVGSACVTFKSSEAMNMAYRHLKKNRIQFGGKPLSLAPASSASIETFRRDFGKEEALTGPNGGSRLDAGIWERGRGVVVWGTPGKLSTAAMVAWLNRQGPFELADKRKPIVKLQDMDTLTSRFIVFANSVPEAHAIVRKLHRTTFDHGDKWMTGDPNYFYTVNARVIS